MRWLFLTFVFILLELSRNIESLFSEFKSRTVIRQYHFRTPPLVSKLRLLASNKNVFDTMKVRIQQLDYSALNLLACELQTYAVPSKVENVVQEDKFNLALQIKNLQGQIDWINLSWHPETCRICLQPSPIITEETLSFESILRAFLKNLILTEIDMPFPFERVVRLRFSEKITSEPCLRSNALLPTTSTLMNNHNLQSQSSLSSLLSPQSLFPHLPHHSLYVEILGSRSNVILVSCDDNSIQAAAYQTSSSSVRSVQTSSQYVPPIVKADRFYAFTFITVPTNSIHLHLHRHRHRHLCPTCFEQGISSSVSR